MSLPLERVLRVLFVPEFQGSGSQVLGSGFWVLALGSLSILTSIAETAPDTTTDLAPSASFSAPGPDSFENELGTIIAITRYLRYLKSCKHAPEGKPYKSRHRPESA